MPRVALITGANGITGTALLERLVHKTSAEEWSTIVITSRSPLRSRVSDPRVRFVQLDFENRPATLIELMTESCSKVTHAFFSSHVHKDNFVDVNKANTTLLENFLLALTCVAPNLERCTLQSSAKYYGVHLCPVPTPCREEDPRRGDSVDNFYHAQEDFLALLQMNQNWKWNVVRPDVIVGNTSSLNGMNTALTLAMYFLITRKLAEEARMPTNQRYWNGSEVVSDASLLAEFMIWVATNAECANEAFNFSDGDHFTWRFMWPRLAGCFGAYATSDQSFVKPEPAAGALQQEFSLAQWAKDKKPVWDRICEDAGIPGAQRSFEAGAWHSQDCVFQRSWSANVSVHKARKFGWTGFVDSFDSFAATFDSFRDQHQIP